MVTNRRVATDTDNDYYPTPEWATHSLMMAEEFEGSVWEPACGDGRMAEVIRQYIEKQDRVNKQVFATDIIYRGYGVQGDFLSIDMEAAPPWIENIITNPPYNLAGKFIERALFHNPKKIAMLLRLNFLEGIDRYKNLYTKNKPTKIYVFSSRVTFYPNGVQTGGSSTQAYAWFIWEPRLPNDPERETIIRWLPPQDKSLYKSK